MFFFINLGVSRTYGMAQTNLQGEVQPMDRPSLQIFKWADSKSTYPCRVSR